MSFFFKYGKNMCRTTKRKKVDTLLIFAEVSAKQKRIFTPYINYIILFHLDACFSECFAISCFVINVLAYFVVRTKEMRYNSIRAEHGNQANCPAQQCRPKIKRRQQSRQTCAAYHIQGPRSWRLKYPAVLL